MGRGLRSLRTYEEISSMSLCASDTHCSHDAWEAFSKEWLKEGSEEADVGIMNLPAWQFPSWLSRSTPGPLPVPSNRPGWVRDPYRTATNNKRQWCQKELICSESSRWVLALRCVVMKRQRWSGNLSLEIPPSVSVNCLYSKQRDDDDVQTEKWRSMCQGCAAIIFTAWRSIYHYLVLIFRNFVQLEEANSLLPCLTRTSKKMRLD